MKIISASIILLSSGAGFSAPSLAHEVAQIEAALTAKSSNEYRLINTKVITYKVAKGDSLNKIAAKYGTTAKKLQKYNGIKNANLLAIGQTIKIPTTEATPKKEVSKPLKASGIYTVMKGDTLYGIARKTGLTTAELKKANPTLQPSKLAIGQKINLTAPNKKTIAPEKPSTEPTPTDEPQKAIIVDDPPTEKPKKTPVAPAPEKPATETIKKAPPKPAPAPETPAEPASPFTKVVITQQVSLSEFAKKYNHTVEEVNDINGWTYTGDTLFDIGSVAYVKRAK